MAFLGLSPCSEPVRRRSQPLLLHCFQRGLLYHGSPREDIEVLQPETKESSRDGNGMLYASSSPALAIRHVLLHNVGDNLHFSHYRSFGRSFLYCVIPEDHAEGLLSFPITLYFLKRDGFTKISKLSKAKILTMGLVDNLGDEWISEVRVYPVGKISMALGEIECDKVYCKKGFPPILQHFNLSFIWGGNH